MHWLRVTAFWIYLVRSGPAHAHRRAVSSPDPRQPVAGDQHGDLLQYLGHPPMQSDGEERHHSDRGSDSPGDAHSRSRTRPAAQAADERQFQALPASARPPDCSQVFPRTLATVLCSPTAKSGATATVTATRPVTTRFPKVSVSSSFSLLLSSCRYYFIYDVIVE